MTSTAATFTSGLLASCGGGSGGAEDDIIDPVGPGDEVELVRELEALEPIPSAFDLRVNPMTLVGGELTLRVIQDGAPVVGAAVQGYGADDKWLFSGVTDETGGFEWSGERTLAVRIVAQGPEGELSLYDIEDPQDSLSPLLLNVLTTLADRLRLARRWLPSQADLRVHQFCGIATSTPLAQTFIDHAEFDHARFAQARAASGLTQDAYLQRLCEQAAADDFMAHAVDFSSTSKALKFDPMSVLQPIFDNAMKVLDGRLSDEEKMDLFGGLLVDLGVLHLTDPVLKALEEISAKLDDIQVSLNKVLEELRKQRSFTLGREINELDKGLSLIRKDMLSKLSSDAKRERINQHIVEYNLVGGDLPFLALRAFIGGLSETGYDPDTAVYPLMFRINNNIDLMTGGFEAGVRDADRMRFFGVERQKVYGQAVQNIKILYTMGLSWAMMYEVYLMAGMAPGSNERANAMSKLEDLAFQLTAYGNMIDALNPVELPHKDVFLELESNAAWFASKDYIVDNPAFYGGWHSWSGSWTHGSSSNRAWSSKWASNLRLCHEMLPPEVKAMTSKPWGPPSQDLLKRTFFTPAGSRRSVADYAVAHGAPSDGVYVINETGKPKLNIWLSDLKYVETRPWVLYDRQYGRFNEKDFRSKSNTCSITDGPYGDTAPPICESYPGDSPWNGGIHHLGNYGNATNYYYPSSTDVIKPEQYFPWKRLREMIEKTNGLQQSRVLDVYGPQLH